MYSECTVIRCGGFLVEKGPGITNPHLKKTTAVALIAQISVLDLFVS